MGGLWVVIGLLSAAVLVLLLAPLLRRPGRREERAEYDIAVYRDQLDEVERDRERGLLDAEQAAAAATEIQRRMLVADGEGEAPRAPTASRGGATALAVGLLVPVGAVGLYLLIGSPGTPDFPVAGRAAASGGAEAGAEVERLVGRLARRLAGQPDDLEGWVLLARTYVTMRRLDDAADAYDRAFQISGGDPGIAADYGEILVNAAGGTVTPAAQHLFQGALEADPRAPKARFYLGAAKAQADDLKGALQAWVDLAALAPPGAPWLEAVRAQIGQVAADLGVDAASVEASPEALALGPPPAAAARPTTVPPGPSRQDVEAAGSMTAGERAEMIRAMVQRLADRLEGQPDDRQGWLRLGRAYQVLGEEEKARHAFARAEALAE